MKSTITHLLTCLLIMLVLLFTSCIETSNSDNTPPLSDYHTVTFDLDGQVKHSFPIYLRNDETLHFMFTTNDWHNSIYLHILTPSGKTVCSYGRILDEPGQYADGTLEDGASDGFSNYRTVFSPSDYGWCEGYYRMEFKNEFKVLATVTAEYWIEK